MQFQLATSTMIHCSIEDRIMANEVMLTALTTREIEEVAELTRAIEEWFREGAERSDFRIDLDACVPAVGESVARGVVDWATEAGFLAHCVERMLVVKKVSRARHRRGYPTR